MYSLAALEISPLKGWVCFREVKGEEVEGVEMEGGEMEGEEVEVRR